MGEFFPALTREQLEKSVAGSDELLKELRAEEDRLMEQVWRIRQMSDRQAAHRARCQQQLDESYAGKPLSQVRGEVAA